MGLIIDIISLVFTKNIIDSKKLGNLVNIRAIYGKSKILNFQAIIGDQLENSQLGICWTKEFICWIC